MTSDSSNLSIVIRSAASGEDLVRLTADDLPNFAETQGTSVRALKQVLAKRINLSRFRQRLLSDCGELLHDDIQLSPPLNLQLVKLEFLKPDDDRDAKFFDACEANSVAEVEDMLCGPQDPDIVWEFPYDDVEGHTTALHVAAENGSLEAVDLLLEAGADMEVPDERERTPLHWAAFSGHLEVARHLLEAGADRDKSDHEQATPLLLASDAGHLEVVRLLLD